MRRNVWSVEELAQILVAANEANANAEALLAGGMLSDENAAVVQAYRQGFKAALTAVALATGVPLRGGAAIEHPAEVHATARHLEFVSTR